jgi:DNA-binding GntR family transcriptional regulator
MTTDSKSSPRQQLEERDSTPGSPTLARIVQQKIVEAIASGVFTPGMHLEEQELASRYQVSRTPVREALRELASLGAVEVKARRGVMVAAMTGDRLIQTLEVIADLEGSCARYAAERMTRVQRIELREINQRIGQAAATNDAAGFDRDNAIFHRLIHAGAHNAILSEAVEQMRQRILPYTRAEFISARERMWISQREHETIAGAIESGQPELAYHATRAHVISAGRVPEDKLALAPADRSEIPLRR